MNKKRNKLNDNRPIVMFDSGFGGLTVLAQVHKHLPWENVIYYGDNARAPYGNQSKENIIKYNEEILRFLQAKGAKAVIMACNTSSALALDNNISKFDLPFISLIDHGFSSLESLTQTRKVAVIATENTIRSGAISKKISQLFNGIEVYEKACPLFVPLIESDLINDTHTEEVARQYLAESLSKGADTIVLGCTHYPLMLPVLKKIAPAAHFLDPAVEAVRYIRHYLLDNNISNSEDHKAQYDYYTSGDPEMFGSLGQKYLGFPIDNVSRKAF